METDIGRTFLFYKTTKEIWDAAKETFSDSENAAEVFEIKSQLLELQQRDLSVTQYFSIFSQYWQKLEVLEEMEWDCVRDSIKYHKIMEKERIFTFLVGLNSIRISMKSEEGILALSHSHHFERRVLKSDKKRVERRSWWRITPHHSPFRATMDQPWPPRDQILNTLIHEGDPTSHGVIIVTKLVIHEKPIGKFMGSRPIGKGTEHRKMNLEVIVPPMMNHHSPITQPTKHLLAKNKWSYFRNSSHMILRVPPL